MAYALHRAGQWITTAPLQQPLLSTECRQAFPHWTVDSALEHASVLRMAFGITVEIQSLTASHYRRHGSH